MGYDISFNLILIVFLNFVENISITTLFIVWFWCMATGGILVPTTSVWFIFYTFKIEWCTWFLKISNVTLFYISFIEYGVIISHLNTQYVCLTIRPSIILQMYANIFA